MKKNSETIVDENGIEILVGYRYEESPKYYAEPGNPGTLVDAMVLTELTSIEVVIAGIGIDILPNIETMDVHLKDKMLNKIINLLNYEE